MTNSADLDQLASDLDLYCLKGRAYASSAELGLRKAKFYEK